ncbi:exported hypothetical protein [Vibrio chagasii]|nr:exported hypothetical protein [Vibrio chagasii]CAH7165616.1 exported hypothetical protein [Vibrio chagasii]
MKPIVITAALTMLMTFTASAEGYKVEYKDINTRWDQRRKYM